MDDVEDVEGTTIGSVEASQMPKEPSSKEMVDDSYSRWANLMKQTQPVDNESNTRHCMSRKRVMVLVGVVVLLLLAAGFGTTTTLLVLQRGESIVSPIVFKKTTVPSTETSRNNSNTAPVETTTKYVSTPKGDGEGGASSSSSPRSVTTITPSPTTTTTKPPAPPPTTFQDTTTPLCLADEDALRFIIVGDNGGSNDFPFTTPIERATARRMEQVADQVGGIDFVLGLGDNFYNHGIKNVADPRFQNTFENVYTGKSLQVPWHMIAGNHDHLGNVSAEIAYTNKSSKWHYPDFYYSVSYTIPNTTASIDILMIDTVLLTDYPDSSLAQWTWINERLKISKATYLFTAGHYPIYSIAEHGPTPILVDLLLPMLKMNKASGHMCGHDHNLQYLQETSDGMTLNFILSGCAAKIDPSERHKGVVPKGVSKFYWADTTIPGGFVLVEATATKMVSKFITADGKLRFTSTTYPRNFD